MSTVAFLQLEWLVIFVLLPLLAFSEWLPVGRGVIFATAVLYAIWHEYPHLLTISQPVVAPSAQYRILLRIGSIVILLFTMAYWLLADQFLLLPLKRTQQWLTIMLLYPLLSAWPQELLYRQFYFRRYANLWPTRSWLLVSNIIGFAFAHIIYHNWVAVIFTVIAGIFFSYNYHRYNNIYWVWLEHTSYGLAVFTSGWGQYFYRPAHC